MYTAGFVRGRCRGSGWRTGSARASAGKGPTGHTIEAFPGAGSVVVASRARAPQSA